MLSDIMNNLPWPEGGEELFRQESNGAEAYLHHMNSFGLYADCYKKEAADALVAISASKRFQRDTLIYPIVFLYRHYLELNLKEIIRYGCRLTGQSSGKRNHHWLDKLWKECVPLILEVWPETNQTELEVVESCISEFMRYDPASFAFRYPTAQDGSPSLPADLRHINLKNLYEVMQKLANYLDGTLSGIMDAVDNLPETPRRITSASHHAKVKRKERFSSVGCVSSVILAGGHRTPAASNHIFLRRLGSAFCFR